MKKLLLFIVLLSTLISCEKLVVTPSITECVITIDDAPEFPTNTARMIEVLEGTPATFFCQGYYLEIYPELGRRIASNFTLANHTYNHPNLNDRPDLLINQIDATQYIIDSINTSLNKPTNRYFRFPYGSCNNAQLTYCELNNIQVCWWDLDASDWNNSYTLYDIQKYYTDRLANFKGTPIILFHLSDNSILGMDWLLKYLKLNNIRVISLDEYNDRNLWVK